MDIKEFIEKIKEKGYDVDHRYLNNNPLDDAFIITKDNYYHVTIRPHVVMIAPFHYLLNLVEHEIGRLKENEVSQ